MPTHTPSFPDLLFDDAARLRRWEAQIHRIRRLPIQEPGLQPTVPGPRQAALALSARGGLMRA